MKKTLVSLTTAAVLGLAASSANASLINVGGVVWDPASLFDFTSTDQMIEQSTDVVGNTISGFGRISAINTLNTFCPSCELTYQFGGYKLENASATAYTFSGGWLNVYVDSGQNFDQTKASTANDGNLWLSLTARSTFDINSQLLGTLHSTPTPTVSGVQGNGRGYFDVSGGLAAGNFDTDTITVLEGAQGPLGKADFSFTSNFQLITTGAITSDDGKVYALVGGNTLTGNSIPEPGSLALIGLGFLGMGALRRRTKA